jgi:hypothetical protein
MESPRDKIPPDPKGSRNGKTKARNESDPDLIRPAD